VALTEDLHERCRDKLKKEISAHYKEAKVGIEAQSEDLVKEVLHDLYRRIILMNNTKPTSSTDYLHRWQSLQTRFFASVSSEAKYKEWALFSLPKIKDGLSLI